MYEDLVCLEQLYGAMEAEKTKMDDWKIKHRAATPYTGCNKGRKQRRL